MYFEFWQIRTGKEIVCQIYIICHGSTFQIFSYLALVKKNNL